MRPCTLPTTSIHDSIPASSIHTLTCIVKFIIQVCLSYKHTVGGVTTHVHLLVSVAAQDPERIVALRTVCNARLPGVQRACEQVT
jgi:hypothetical protein